MTLRAPSGGRRGSPHDPAHPAAPASAGACASRSAFPSRSCGLPTTRSAIASIIEARVGDSVEQRDQRLIGLRTVRVVGGQLLGQRAPVRCAAPRSRRTSRAAGPALTDADMDEIVARPEGGARQRHARALPAQRPPPRPPRRRRHPGLEPGADLPPRRAPAHAGAARATRSTRSRGTVLAARNHPSVIAHSVANELSAVPDTVPGTRALPRRRAPPDAELDPTRPAGGRPAQLPGLPAPGHLRAASRCSASTRYFGWYPGKDRRTRPAISRTCGPISCAMRRMYPRSALVMTEFGAEATVHGPADRQADLRFQARVRRRDAADRRLAAVRQRRDLLDAAGVRGQAHWDGGAHRRLATRRDPQQGPDHLRRRAQARLATWPSGLRRARRSIRPDRRRRRGARPTRVGWVLVLGVPIGDPRRCSLLSLLGAARHLGASLGWRAASAREVAALAAWPMPA